jgi:hypothetical protein
VATITLLRVVLSTVTGKIVKSTAHPRRDADPSSSPLLPGVARDMRAMLPGGRRRPVKTSARRNSVHSGRGLHTKQQTKIHKITRIAKAEKLKKSHQWEFS